ncbi:MAG: 30S ribosomal protein S8 [Candidatus Woesearchaeota archaeon]
MLNDPLANMFSKIKNYEKIARKKVEIEKVSNTIKKILDILKDNGYVGEWKQTISERGGVIELNLLGTINDCGVVKPRHAVQINNYEKFEKRFLPAKDFGILIISTNKGIMTHIQAKENKLGGRLIAYCY